MKRSKTITIAIIIGVVASVLIVVFGTVACFNYYFHRTVNIQTEYDISAVTWYASDYGNRETVNSKSFTHFAQYGRFNYCFDLYVEDRTIPVEISVFKTENYKHDNVNILIYQGNSDPEIIVDVKAGYPNSSQKYWIYETDLIEISLGP